MSSLIPHLNIVMDSVGSGTRKINKEYFAWIITYQTVFADDMMVFVEKCIKI